MMVLPFSATPAITTRLIDRYDGAMHFKPRLIVGYMIALTGAAVMALSVWLPNTAVILLGLGLLGVSMGYITPAMTTGVLTSSPAETSGIASGILNAGRQVGASIGVALMGTLVQIHHEHGMILSFASVVVLCAILIAAAKRVIPAS